MMQDTWGHLDSRFMTDPIMRAKEGPSRSELDDAAREIGVSVDPDLSEFIIRYGGAVVGAFPIYGLRPVELMGDDRWSIMTLTGLYRSQLPGLLEDWCIFSEDHAGNPIGIRPDGSVWIFDHDFGGADKIYDNFEMYIRKQCLNID